MNASGDAAEQVIRMALEGTEVAVKITGAAAKDIAMITAAVLRKEGKSKGKARLGKMIKSGKELKVFSIRQKDVKKFSQEAKRYGVLYCVLKEKGNKNGEAIIDVIARAEDAPKINRIIERFQLTTVDIGSMSRQAEREEMAKAQEKNGSGKLLDEVLINEEKETLPNPQRARAEKSGLSLQDSDRQMRGESKTSMTKNDKPSIRKKLMAYRRELRISADRKPDRGETHLPSMKKVKKGRER